MIVRSVWSRGPWATTIFLVLWTIENVRGKELTPDYFNLAEGKKITATATCGEDSDGPELFCKLTGANSEYITNQQQILQGQLCDYCDPSRPDKRHPPEFAIDGTDNWWQSPPLSRGMKYNEVNLTIDLGQEFHVAYVFITMGNSPRPRMWILEKSTDYGKTYTPWQYFAESPEECEMFFGTESTLPITRDDSVICETEYSKILPLENAEIPISLLNGRPSQNNYFNSTVLQEWTRATNVRLRLLRTKTLLGHLMSLERQDHTVTRRYFYSIKDISIGGRCMCNGHADTCDIQDAEHPTVLLCRCQHNTCGAKCDTCCPGFEQKKWRISKHDHPFSCEPCNCFQHSNECIYDEDVDKNKLSLDIHGRYEGGGVCKNCQHNTEGINCNKCKAKFYRPYSKRWNDTDVCQPCNCNQFFSTGNCAEETGICECRKEFKSPNCDECNFGYFGYPDCKPCECFLNGTQHSQCEAKDGQCPCRHNFGGHYCKECSRGYYGFPECKQCECTNAGAVTDVCDQETGNCTCKNGYSGKNCEQCADGYYKYPTCSYCNCDIRGTKEGICDKNSGQCICKEGYDGDRCDSCLPGYYGYPDCKPCNCSKTGSLATTCSSTGKCQCLSNFAGKTCEQCSPGFYQYPKCLACECDTSGSNGISCDNEGKCECHHNFAGRQCDVCKEGFYNFPECEDCNCHPAGVVAGFAGCGSVPAGELCQCKERVEGRICNKCRPLYWNLSPLNRDGCEECNCHIPGVLGGIAVCDSDSGQCTCKSLVVSRGCSECADGTYDLQEGNLFGCSDCDCDVGGSLNNICDKRSGQCPCHARVTGRTCKEPLQAHYFPTLFQFQYEVEDGHTPSYTAVRYSHDESLFPGYSWRGYAVFQLLQNKILQDIYVNSPSLYRMVLRYVNKNTDPVVGIIRITPENPLDNEQEFQVLFKNTSEPSFVTVSGASGKTPSAFVMNPGRWQVAFEIDRHLLLDYFVLLPEDFYSANILNRKVEKPCTINEKDLCREYTYLNLSRFDTTYGVGGFIPDGYSNLKLKDFFQDQDHLKKLNVGSRVPFLNNMQPFIAFNVSVNKPGRYVIIINYVTELEDLNTHYISAQITSDYESNEGTAILYACPYTELCRQLLVNPEGGVGVFDIKENYFLLNLNSTSSNVGIHSISAIPFGEWSLDYIIPKSVCIKKDGKCIAASFRNPPETKKIQFEEGMEDTVTLSNVTYMWLKKDTNTLDLKGKVSEPGYYTFIVHYYQPHFHDFPITVLLQNGQFYEATLSAQYCPSPSGCRAVIKQSTGNTKFSLTENFMITFKESENKNVYLDYLLVIPADLYNDRYLEENDIDRTDEFISTCGSNHFNIDTIEEGFCRDAVFTITAGYNNGALPCKCDYDGSLSFECNKFGGQCICKPNIIGRKCEACKTGYYGFPDCKPCNCPTTAYCEPNTGQCICPARVVGDRCDQCEPLTYGYDPMIGCEECKCNPLGVQHSLQCDLFNGSCSCKNNIIGRQCDKCVPGYHTFPYCENCDCELAGTIDDICDQVTAECFCKKNVVGPDCSICKDGTFNLQPYNPEGCTECFCFGKTTRCLTSKLIRYGNLQMEDWQIVNANTLINLEVSPTNISVQQVEEFGIEVDFTNTNSSNKTYYFSAPVEYVGKKLTTYGGFLNYTIFYTISDKGSAVGGPDVILEGRKTYLTYSSLEQPPPATEFPASVQIVENNFELPSGSPARRDHIMTVLGDLKGIYIRATYWTESVTTRLLNVIQDDAVLYQYFHGDSRNLQYAESVEECICPPAYTGLSCEECAPGYYRIDSGPHGGYCVPCNCHGHATECDLHTGICFNCTHNTRGDHCEMCDVGYHGNARAGTPNDCLICACPLPTLSNNFASSCEVSADGEKISCQCNEGYIGARCQSCAAGYYGKPEDPDDYCKPCQCSGNINPKDPASCDTHTGQCLRCLNNTTGAACALCAPGYYGDAIVLKNCQSCICDSLGTDICNSHTGECVCKPNVIGDKCDRCDDNHWGFQSGTGCIPCKCGEASEGERCDDVTGNCRCKPGVSGRTCDRCSAGYWNYTTEGCISCGCKSEYSLGFGCNAETGQCECLQGVQGEKCDQCPYRWVFVPDYGCHSCDSCTHNLLDTANQLSALIDPIIFEFDAANSGYFTRRKLENIREQLKVLEPRFDEIDPQQIKLEPYILELETLEQDSKNLNRKANYSLENSEVLKMQSGELKEKAEELLDDLLNAEEESLRVIDEIDKITFQLNNEEGPEIEAALEAANEIMDAIRTYNLTERNDTTNREFDKVTELLINVNDFKLPVDQLADHVGDIRKDLRNFNNKLDDLYNQTQYSLNNANEAQRIIDKSGKDRLKKKIGDIANQTKESENNLVISQELNDNSTKNNMDAKHKLKDLEKLLDELDVTNEGFRIDLDNNENDISAIHEMEPVVEQHAKNLTDRAMTLDSLLTETRDISHHALRAANAYKDIVDAVKNAKDAAIVAQSNANTAVDLLNGIEDRTFETDQKSSDGLGTAHELHDNTTDDLRPRLNIAHAKFSPVKMIFDDNANKLKDLENILLNIQSRNLDETYKNASLNADNAVRHVEDIDDTANKIFIELPQETEKAQALPKNVDDTKRELLQTKKQLNSVNEKLPTIVELIDEFPRRQHRLERAVNSTDNSLNKLKQQIALARDFANQIKIGMKFYPNTTLVLQNPPNLEDLSTSTKISGYFKTAKPDGLIWYLGNPVGTNLRRTKTDDYMALVIQNGYPVLKMNIGNGPEQVISEKHVSDNNWYQFIIDRTGHNAKLTIREENAGVAQETVNEKTLEGPYSIFNLDKNKSKIFVGSFPVNYERQNEIDVNFFEGEIEDLVIGDTPVSLWNFNLGSENNLGAIERDKLVNLQPSTGYRFNGNGYVIINARSYNLRYRSDIQLSFKTFATEGLLFFTQQNKTFIALELRNGKILYQYNLGSGTTLYSTTKAYNDGIWHTVEASREGYKGKLTVDGESITDPTSSAGGSTLEPIDTISIGGYPSKHSFHEVTNIKFDGCIDNVVIMGSSLDLRNHIKAYDVSPGCPDRVARLISFKQPGYFSHNDLSVNNDFKLSLKFKTKEKDGLIFYGTDNLHTSNISLALRDGHMVLISQRNELISKDTFNDNEWHVVSVMHNNRELRVDFDDYGHRVTDTAPPSLFIPHGILYIGWLPRRMHISSGTVGSLVPFKGCIGDLTLNGSVINFANTTDKQNDILGKCILDEHLIDTDTGVHTIPNLPNIDDFDLQTTPKPEIQTQGPWDRSTTIRGDGGWDEYVPPPETAKPPIDQVPKPTQPPQPEREPGRVPETTPHVVEESCALPLDPSEENTSSVYRFGTQKDSRMEFHTLRGKYRKHFDASLAFKTTQENGIIFYLSDDKDHSDYIAIYIQNKKLVYVYKAGDKSSQIQSASPVNDNKWYTIKFGRDKNIQLVIEGSSEIENLYGSNFEDSKIDLRPPLYIGGLQPIDYNLVATNLNMTESFQGCIRDIHMNSKPLENPVSIGIIPCSENVETGTFFSSAGGYVKLKERFKVGELFSVKLDIKPRLDSGVLIAVHGKRDYLVLEMVKGVMKFTVDNGRGPITASFKPKQNFYFCDGQWHNIQAVKSKSVVTLSVDSVFTDPSLGDHHDISADTGSALFLGGHKYVKRVRGIVSKTPYVGCIKNVHINNELIEIKPSMAENNITVGSCRTN